jgi:hypothetical protein
MTYAGLRISGPVGDEQARKRTRLRDVTVEDLMYGAAQRHRRG